MKENENKNYLNRDEFEQLTKFYDRGFLYQLSNSAQKMYYEEQKYLGNIENNYDRSSAECA